MRQTFGGVCELALVHQSECSTIHVHAIGPSGRTTRGFLSHIEQAFRKTNTVATAIAAREFRIRTPAGIAGNGAGTPPCHPRDQIDLALHLAGGILDTMSPRKIACALSISQGRNTI
jgi:hypothetical protein